MSMMLKLWQTPLNKAPREGWGGGRGRKEQIDRENPKSKPEEQNPKEGDYGAKGTKIRNYCIQQKTLY
jgi:hypothetical protein